MTDKEKKVADPEVPETEGTMESDAADATAQDAATEAATDTAADGMDADAEEAAADETETAEDVEDEEMAQKLKDADDKYMRLMAEFQNYRRRTEEEKAAVYSFANEKIMTELLTVMDNFERALAQGCSDEAYQTGMEQIFKQMTDLLAKQGLAEIEALGEVFDPNLHHAVLTDDNEEFGSGCVTAVLQKGYTMNEKVIRPAMVKVNN